MPVRLLMSGWPRSLLPKLMCGTGVGVFQCLPLVGWCVAHAVFPSYHLQCDLSVNPSIDLRKVALKIEWLKAFTRVRQRLKYMNQLRRKGNVVN